MRFSLNWLTDYVDIDVSPQELGELLTMKGLEVDAIEPLGENLQQVVAARILEVKPHPKAERLYLCAVDTGAARLQVVCGAPNAQANTVAAFAPPGCRLPNGTVIGESTIRDEISSGVLLAEDEMGLTDDHTGIMVLPEEVKPGSAVDSILGLPDWAIEVDITPNRADCTCLLGIAREVAAATGKPLKTPKTTLDTTGPAAADMTSVTIQDPEGCPRYAAGVIQGVKLGPSPFWMRYRLHVSGLRAINSVVDATNYVMLEMGQPLHAFDYHRLRENRIVVRRGRDGETFTTLDGVTHRLSPEILMICDGEGPVAVAGIMGGLNSEIFAGTQDVLLESAFFNPVTIRQGAKFLGVSTEASYRFERGADVEGAPLALERALSLMASLSGGRVGKGIVDNYPDPRKPTVIQLEVDKTNRLLGTSLTATSIGRYLESLEMTVESVDPNRLRVVPPSFRVDITRDVDLMEEVARMDGYDNIPVTYPSIKPTEEPHDPELGLREAAKSIMVGLGFSEVITYSFVSPGYVDAMGADEDSPLRSFVTIVNPLSRDQSVMRTSLLPGLMEAVRYNVVRGEEQLKLFEWGKVFLERSGGRQPEEVTVLAAILTGPFTHRTWNTPARTADFYDIKGAVEVVLEALKADEFRFLGEHFPGYLPGGSASIQCGEETIGRVGQLSGPLMAAYDLGDREAYLFELEIPKLIAHLPQSVRYRPVPKFPAVYRDVSLVVDREVTCSQVMDIIKTQGSGLVESVQLFDVYQGDRLEPSEKAMGFSICYRSEHETLEGSEVNDLHESIVQKIREKTGGRLREG